MSPTGTHNTSSVTSMLDHLEWESLEARRAKNQLTMFFKIIHGLVDIPACDYLVLASTRKRSQHSLKFLQILVSSEYYKFSFFPRSVCHWNSTSQCGWSSQFGILQTGALKSVNLNCLARPCKYILMISLSMCCRVLRVPWYLHGR